MHAISSQAIRWGSIPEGEEGKLWEQFDRACSSGSVPEEGRMSWSTRCVLRRKRRQRPVFTGKSQATERHV